VKYLLSILLVLFVISCEEDIPEDKEQYWTRPTIEATRLAFRLSDSIRLDSTFAGNIQFRLNKAREVNETLPLVTVWWDWELGKLQIQATDELISSFDTSAYRFNYPPVDSLLDLYETTFIEQRSHGWFSIIVPEYYNIRILAGLFKTVDLILYAEPNIYGTLMICDTDVSLEIEGELYKFIFSRWGSMCPLRHWEVHVINDQAELIDEW